MVGSVLVYAAGVVVAGFNWWRDMGINPERPKSIVKVKSDELRQWQTVRKG